MDYADLERKAEQLYNDFRNDPQSIALRLYPIPWEKLEQGTKNYWINLVLMCQLEDEHG